MFCELTPIFICFLFRCWWISRQLAKSAELLLSLGLRGDCSRPAWTWIFIYTWYVSSQITVYSKYGLWTIEIVVTSRNSLIKEKSAINYWHIWVANQLTISPVLVKTFLSLCYETVYFSAELQPNTASILSRFSLLSSNF